MMHGKELAQKILSEGWKAFDFRTMADYKAEFFPKSLPNFISLRGITRGRDYRYVAVHHFLKQVGKDNSFVSLIMVDDKDVFDRLILQGVVKKEGPTTDPAYEKYKVIKDPMENLKDYARAPEDPGPFHISVMGIGPPEVA